LTHNAFFFVAVKVRKVGKLEIGRKRASGRSTDDLLEADFQTAITPG
jgi:hypothetical protein